MNTSSLGGKPFRIAIGRTVCALALAALIGAGAQVGQQTTEQAGAALAAGRPEEAVARSSGCLPDPSCALVRGRAVGTWSLPGGKDEPRARPRGHD